jgi:hypothetical protein
VQFAGFGTIFAATISPTWGGHRVGSVLLERFEDAHRASTGLQNVLLHPAVDQIKLIGGFIESEKATAVCLAVYNLPETITDAMFDRRCQDAPAALSIAVVSDAGTRSGFAHFSNSRALTAAYWWFADVGNYSMPFTRWAKNGERSLSVGI